MFCCARRAIEWQACVYVVEDGRRKQRRGGSARRGSSACALHATPRLICHAKSVTSLTISPALLSMLAIYRYDTLLRRRCRRRYLPSVDAPRMRRARAMRAGQWYSIECGINQRVCEQDIVLPIAMYSVICYGVYKCASSMRKIARARHVRELQYASAMRLTCCSGRR